ncbi:MAG: polyamine aminopropyltransferase [Deltaproteobacteria bacterium]|nr:polyamine aminopropyltransferase [Deltaproteobacteria bacterium]
MTHWYTESYGDSLKYSFACKNVLFDEQSPYQRVQVFETQAYGRMLVIDECVMLTDDDEFVYHEMISHIPACYHKDPRVAVVIGGGDGGTVRELLKYPGIEKVVLCEIDKMVVDASRQFFPGVAGKLDDPRVDLRIGDGVAYIQELKNFADLIIVDSTDPVGPGEGLFTKAFYQSVRNALKPGGLMVAQSESPWDKPEFLRRIYDNIAGGFSYIRPYIAPVPTYPRGCWSWMLASGEELSDHAFQQERFETVREGCLYLTEASARSCFSLPAFYRRKLGLL